MQISEKAVITIKGARTHNLDNISLEIPHHQLIVVTGISGSGKSSLAFDVIAREGQRRYFETLPSFARQFTGKLSQPDTDVINGLAPVIAINQKTGGNNQRSTVGTLSDIYSWLRLLFAREGTSERPLKTPLTRSLFSFNSDHGKCPKCSGIGKEEKIDLNKLIINPEKTLRQGALAPTLPTGYIMYSQVTMDVLNQVCMAEGFNVDIPWKDLSEISRNVILHGSTKIKVPFGKHSLESRLKWTGIKAKPREEGYYKGMIPIMSDILRRDRNPNILKYVSAVTCSECQGKRLNQIARSVLVNGKSIDELLEMSFLELTNWINQQQNSSKVFESIAKKLNAQLSLLIHFGLGHLRLNQATKTLSGSELQRIRLTHQLTADLSNVLYVFDEPCIGLHQDENRQIINALKRLVNRGNTVIIVEHNPQVIKAADWIIDIGPKAGKEGGKVLFNGAMKRFLQAKELEKKSLTHALLTNESVINTAPQSKKTFEEIQLINCFEPPLNGQDFTFKKGGLNVVAGKAGSGKRALINNSFAAVVKRHLHQTTNQIKVGEVKNIDSIDQLIYIDQAPIGRTPRSNPATYLGISDHIRTIFAKLPEAKTRKLTRSHFSFNTKGGRCETCQGAGKTQIGMHYLGKIDLVCETCNGRRFNEKTLAVTYKNKSIDAIYNLTVNEAILFFEDTPKIQRSLTLLHEIGLGYVQLGQSSTTLSGGEGQRIKLVNELQKNTKGHVLYIFEEPEVGLHAYDIENLLNIFHRILKNNNTIACISQNALIQSHADQPIELTTANSTPQEVVDNEKLSTRIALTGIQTHSLQNISINIPKNKLTVLTGLSGSGKSSLAYDTLYAEAESRFSESLSTFNRSFIQQKNAAIIESAKGLTPTIALRKTGRHLTNRSTVGTLSGVYDHLRLLYSRIAQLDGHEFTAQHFSFNHKSGACPQCTGIGLEQKCNPDRIVLDETKSILEGALSKNKALNYYGNPQGQFMATLQEAALQIGWKIDQPWNKLSTPVQNSILYGIPDTEWDVDWKFKTKTRSGVQKIKAKWLGFCNYIDAEFQLKKHNKNIQNLLDLLHDVPCSSCGGARLQKHLLEVRFLSKNIMEFCDMSIAECRDFIMQAESTTIELPLQKIIEVVFPAITKPLQTIAHLGLDYLNLNRNGKTLSGGELQRLLLAGQLSNKLFGVTYVLDEPTIGLDTKQTSVLIQLLGDLVKHGNTIVLIEHDEQVIRNADYLIEMGPGSGKNGGKVMFQGPFEKLPKDTLTYKLLNTSNPLKKINRNTSGHPFGIKGAYKNNLKEIDVTFQSGMITAVTGVSGSGKSSLVKDVIFDSARKKRAIFCKFIFGFEQFDHVSLVDQKPLSLNTLTTPVTYTGILDELRVLFAQNPSAKELSLKKADFSYQSKTGRCTNCNGYGETKVELDFMSTISQPCETCNGLRYNEKVLSCRIELNEHHYSIGELLKTTAEEVLSLLPDHKITATLQLMVDLGIGHLQLGQAGITLSGGEAQRLKLTRELISNTGPTLYLLDEPSTGLHQYDLEKLAFVFNTLVKNGNTVIFIEHNSALIEIAHKELKLGPGSGDQGGELVVS